jgi:hypothetical protein
MTMSPPNHRERPGRVILRIRRTGLTGLRRASDWAYYIYNNITYFKFKLTSIVAYSSRPALRVARPYAELANLSTSRGKVAKRKSLFNQDSVFLPRDSFEVGAVFDSIYKGFDFSFNFS